jgi:hypothetical protein
VNLNRSFVSSEVCPRKNRQAQINCCGIDCVYGGLQVINVGGLIGTQFASSSDEQHGELLEDSKVPVRIGIGKGTAGNRASEAQMIELLLSRPKAVLNIAQAFPKSKLRESERQKVVPRRQFRGFVVTPIFADKTSKITLRKEVNDLRENKASRVHG